MLDELTEGERLIWAAAFALAVHHAKREPEVTAAEAVAIARQLGRKAQASETAPRTFLRQMVNS